MKINLMVSEIARISSTDEADRLGYCPSPRIQEAYHRSGLVLFGVKHSGLLTLALSSYRSPPTQSCPLEGNMAGSRSCV